MRQMTFSCIGFQAHHKQARRERFLSEMEAPFYSRTRSDLQTCLFQSPQFGP